MDCYKVDEIRKNRLMANNSILSYTEVDRVFMANGKAWVVQKTVKEE